MPHKFSITRDAHGIPHVRAADRLAAFAGQAFAMCEDRFWQMEVDRRYSSGTLSSLLATDGAKASDAFIRRSRVVESYKDDIAALNASTREMLHAFAVGVNAYLAECRAGKREWPVEWRELNLPAPEDWMVVDSLAVFKGGFKRRIVVVERSGYDRGLQMAAGRHRRRLSSRSAGLKDSRFSCSGI